MFGTSVGRGERICYTKLVCHHEQKMAEPGEKPTLTKRPAIVVTCTIIFAVLAFQALTVLAVLLKAAPRHVDFLIVIPAALAVNAFVCLLCFARSQITYYITSVATATLILKGLYVALTFKGSIPPLDPNSPLNRLGHYLLVLAFCLLFWHFAFGRRSRTFYGLVRDTNK